LILLFVVYYCKSVLRNILPGRAVPVIVAPLFPQVRLLPIFICMRSFTTLRGGRSNLLEAISASAEETAYLVQFTGVTLSVPNQASAWTNGPICLRQGGRTHPFSTNMLHIVQHVCGKRSKVPCCRRRNTPLLEANGLFARAPRKSCNSHEYAVTDPAEHFASGRAEEARSYSQKIHCVNLFVNKDQKYHAAAGDSAIHRVKRPI